MGNYNADSVPDLDKIRMVAFGFGFAPQVDLKTDQFSTVDTTKVYNLTKKIGSTRLRVLVDPAEIPGV